MSRALSWAPRCLSGCWTSPETDGVENGVLVAVHRVSGLCEDHQACSGHCLLEDMLVRVLMLLVSVTTIADGNREVWEY